MVELRRLIVLCRHRGRHKSLFVQLPVQFIVSQRFSELFYLCHKSRIKERKTLEIWFVWEGRFWNQLETENSSFFFSTEPIQCENRGHFGTYGLWKPLIQIWMWREASVYLDVTLWGANLLKRTRNFFFSLKGTGRETDWQPARSVNQALLRHLRLGIWKWKPLKSVNLLSTLKILFSPHLPPLVPALKVQTVCFLSHLSFLGSEALAFRIWLTALWEWAKIEFNLHLSVLFSGRGRSLN